MIEVEKKFILSAEQQQELLEGAESLSTKAITIEDLYFDTEDYRLTSQNLWLRQRDGDYELKAPLQSDGDSRKGANRFRELTSLDEIRAELQLASDVDFEVALSRAGIERFMTCYTNRKSYLKDQFKIDIDKATYSTSLFTHAVAEIELLVDEESQADAAEESIIEFAKAHNLATDQIVLGKIAAFLQVERPKHFRQLVAAHVL